MCGERRASCRRPTSASDTDGRRGREELARAAGISRRTLARLENGEPTQFENLLRTLIALGLEDGLERLVPEVPRSPIQQLEQSGRTRRRATGRRKSRSAGTEPWSWDDES